MVCMSCVRSAEAYELPSVSRRHVKDGCRSQCRSLSGRYIAVPIVRSVSFGLTRITYSSSLAHMTGLLNLKPPLLQPFKELYIDMLKHISGNPQQTRVYIVDGSCIHMYISIYIVESGKNAPRLESAAQRASNFSQAGATVNSEPARSPYNQHYTCRSIQYSRLLRVVIHRCRCR